MSFLIPAKKPKIFARRRCPTTGAKDKKTRTKNYENVPFSRSFFEEIIVSMGIELLSGSQCKLSKNREHSLSITP